ncbi:NifU family protein [Ekhidna sp.]|uniref:NifU family protein n=1 Tax=Ekhidna sp. TaxID=2608089 RepID=UPI003B5126C4
MQMTEEPRVVNIYTESNPNPNSLKFVANFMLMPEGISRDFPNIESTSEAPLAKALFNEFDFVTGVFYMSNFITVTKKEATEWFEVKSKVQHFIKDFLTEGKSIITEEITDNLDEELTGDDAEAKIKGVLEEYIKPAVEMDGGAIKLSSYKDGVVTVTLQGSCSGCPSSTITLKNGIENLLKRMVPEVKEVVAEEG